MTNSALASTTGLAPQIGLEGLPLNIARNALAGAPQGLVNVEANSLAFKHQLNFAPAEVGSNTLNFMAFGGLLGAFDSFDLHGQHEVNAKTTDEIARRFPSYTSENLAAGRAAVVKEMSAVRASSENGRAMSAMDKLNESDLSASQKEQILNALAAFRENYTTSRDSNGMDQNQEKNWIHTQGELGRVLDSARLMKLTPNETEDAMLASMFSDAVKAKANFTVHHIDGARAAQQHLGRYLNDDFDANRLHQNGWMKKSIRLDRRASCR